MAAAEAAAAAHAAAQPASGPLFAACGPNPGISCRLIWDISHSARAADLTKVFFAGPVHLALRIGFVLLIALLLRAAAHRTISRATARARRENSSRPEKAREALHERRYQRADALDSILRNAASVTIFSIALLIIAGDMGLNLAPVLASAGVLGVAIGFGAQQLVRDFLAGIFMVLEDQYGVGVTGTVEGVSLRITRVRDVNGVVWYIRNGTIKKAGNESQGWARAVVDFPVPYHHDVGRVRELMLAATVTLWQDSSWRDVILEAPEVWGVHELSSEAVVMRVTARTKPMRQWEVARELRECLKRALDAVVDAAAPDRPALAPEGPALAPEGPALAPEGPALAPEGPALAPEGPALADAPVLPAGQASPTGTAPAGL
jgi:small conductance mechanosensitive channel